MRYCTGLKQWRNTVKLLTLVWSESAFTKSGA